MRGLLFGVAMLPEEFFGSGLFWEVPSSLMFPYSALPWLYSGYITCVSRRYFWLLFHTFPCESGPRILRSILGQIKFFCMRPSYSAVTGPVCTGNTGFVEDDFMEFPFSWYASFDSGFMIMRRLRKLRVSHVCPLVSGSHLYVSWWFCWFWCTSRCVSSCRQAQDTLHHGRYGPEGVFTGSGMCKAGIAGIISHFTLCSLWPFTAPDALHHGQYGPEVLGHGRSHARCVQRHMPMVQTA